MRVVSGLGMSRRKKTVGNEECYGIVQNVQSFVQKASRETLDYLGSFNEKTQEKLIGIQKEDAEILGEIKQRNDQEFKTDSLLFSQLEMLRQENEKVNEYITNMNGDMETDLNAFSDFYSEIENYVEQCSKSRETDGEKIINGLRNIFKKFIPRRRRRGADVEKKAFP